MEGIVTKYIDADCLKAEIERRIEAIAKAPSDNGVMDSINGARGHELMKLLSFLSTLETETTYDTQQYSPRPSVSIDDVARVQFASHAKVFDKKRKAVFDWEQFKEVAGIFYGFGKRGHSDTLESEKPMNLDLEIEIEDYVEQRWQFAEDLNAAVPIYLYDMTLNELKDCARHFAQWGAEHLKK